MDSEHQVKLINIRCKAIMTSLRRETYIPVLETIT